MALVTITKDGGSATLTSSYNSVYNLLKQISVQEIENTQVGSLMEDFAPIKTVENGETIQKIAIQMAKDATAYDKDTFFPDKTLNKPEFIERFWGTWVKRQYNVGYNRKDIADSLTAGKSEEQIKAQAVGNIGEKRKLDDEQYLAECLFGTSDKLQVTHTNLSTFRTISTDLKDIPYNIRQVLNKLVRFNSFGCVLGNDSSGTAVEWKHGTSATTLKVAMSETVQNILDTFCKSGIYNLQYIYDNFKVITIPDELILANSANNAKLGRIYIMEDDHVLHAIRDHVVESQYDAPSQTYGVFDTSDEMWGTNPLMKAVYFDVDTAIADYIG